MSHGSWEGFIYLQVLQTSPVLTMMKLNARARFVAESFLTPVCSPSIVTPALVNQKIQFD